MSNFVKTTTKIIEEKTVQRVCDGYLPNFAYISVLPMGSKSIDLVVGARSQNRVACHFCKKDLQNLIEVLKEIESAME